MLQVTNSIAIIEKNVKNKMIVPIHDNMNMKYI